LGITGGNDSGLLNFSMLEIFMNSGRNRQFKQKKAERFLTLPLCSKNGDNYFLNLRLAPARPSNPELRRSIVVGSGTGAKDTS